VMDEWDYRKAKWFSILWWLNLSNVLRKK
jgi:hypothetical protein